MIVKKLQIQNFRNLEQVDLSPHPALNIIHGDNGAGKTSILEALIVLSRGRSFRTTQAGEIVGPRAKTFSIFARILAESERSLSLGLERSGKRWRGRMNGVDLSQLSQLTRELPLVLVEPDSHLLVSGSPEYRRKFLDWGMFHVEQGYLETWRRYAKALKQRNSALRQGRADFLDGLDEVLSKEGELLDEVRKSHTEQLRSRLPSVLKDLKWVLEDVSVTYQSGWNADTFREALLLSRDRDMERGQTQSGPHRAEMSFRCGNVAAKALLSRGEQKMFSTALLLAQSEVLAEKGEKPALLLDDLASEFDAAHCERALEKALETGGQVWLTGTRAVQTGADHAVFHVEQGAVREMV